MSLVFQWWRLRHVQILLIRILLSRGEMSEGPGIYTHIILFHSVIWWIHNTSPPHHPVPLSRYPHQVYVRPSKKMYTGSSKNSVICNDWSIIHPISCEQQKQRTLLLAFPHYHQWPDCTSVFCFYKMFLIWITVFLNIFNDFLSINIVTNSTNKVFPSLRISQNCPKLCWYCISSLLLLQQINQDLNIQLLKDGYRLDEIPDDEDLDLIPPKAVNPTCMCCQAAPSTACQIQ